MSKRALLFGLFAASRAFAYEGDGHNPGSWKMLPTSIEIQASGPALRLKNLDLFPKLCSLVVQRKGTLILEADRLLFRADRSMSLSLPAAEPELSIDDLKIGLACVKLLPNETEASVPTPKDLSCSPQNDDCEQSCKAALDQPNACLNDHLAVAFDRSSWTVTESEQEWTAEATFHQQTEGRLTCQFLATAKIVGSDSEVSFLINPSPITVLSADANQTVRWSFNKAEAGAGRTLDLSRPRVVGLCAPGTQKKSENWYFSCDPLKRSECNWVTQKN